MKTYVNLWDALFGEKMIIEVPLPNGKFKKVEVTKKWFEEMRKEKKINEIQDTVVKINILDPLGHMQKIKDPVQLMEALEEETSDHRIEYWRIGKEITIQQYEKFHDKKTDALYAFVKYENGKPTTTLTNKDLWLQALQLLNSL